MARSPFQIQGTRVSHYPFGEHQINNEMQCVHRYKKTKAQTQSV
jgi:hypothetical protein